MDFVFAITVERCPLDVSRFFLVRVGPVEDNTLISCTAIVDRELTAFV